MALPEHNDDGEWVLPVPARFVLDRDGVVRDAAFHADYTQRPEPADLVEIVAAL